MCVWGGGGGGGGELGPVETTIGFSDLQIEALNQLK